MRRTWLCQWVRKSTAIGNLQECLQPLTGLGRLVNMGIEAHIKSKRSGPVAEVFETWNQVSRVLRRRKSQDAHVSCSISSIPAKWKSFSPAVASATRASVTRRQTCSTKETSPSTIKADMSRTMTTPQTIAILRGPRGGERRGLSVRAGGRRGENSGGISSTRRRTSGG